jgi:nicotinamidase-related amidase
VWCVEMTLKEAFPDLYNIFLVKDAFVAVNLDSSSGLLQWNVSFFCAAHDWEFEVLPCCIPLE